jgi:hypothetical protein
MANSEYISQADSTFYDMLDRAGLKKKDKTLNILRAAFLAGGMPYIEAHDKPIRAHFVPSREKRRLYWMDTNIKTMGRKFRKIF